MAPDAVENTDLNPLPAEQGDALRQAEELMNLGRALTSQRRRVEAAEAFERAASAAEIAGASNVPGAGQLQGQALANAGVSLHRANQPQEALRLCDAAISVFAQLDDPAAQRRVETNRAVIHRDIGDAAAALDAARRAAAFTGPGPEMDDVELSSLRSELSAALGRSAEARQHAEAALRIARDLGDDRVIGRQLERLGVLLIEQGDGERALPVCFASLSHQRHIEEDPDGGYRATMQLAVAYQLLGRWPDALAALLDARRLAQHSGHIEDLPRLLAGLAATHLALGQRTHAEEAAGSAVAAYRELGDPAGLGRSLITLGQCLAGRSEHGQASRLWAESLELMRDVDPPGAAVAAELLQASRESSAAVTR